MGWIKHGTMTISRGLIWIRGVATANQGIARGPELTTNNQEVRCFSLSLIQWSLWSGFHSSHRGHLSERRVEHHVSSVLWVPPDPVPVSLHRVEGGLHRPLLPQRSGSVWPLHHPPRYSLTGARTQCCWSMTWNRYPRPLCALWPREAAACSRTAKPATTERGGTTTTSSSMGSSAPSVAEAGAGGTVKVSCYLAIVLVLSMIRECIDHKHCKNTHLWRFSICQFGVNVVREHMNFFSLYATGDEWV